LTNAGRYRLTREDEEMSGQTENASRAQQLDLIERIRWLLCIPWPFLKGTLPAERVIDVVLKSTFAGNTLESHSRAINWKVDYVLAEHMMSWMLRFLADIREKLEALEVGTAAEETFARLDRLKRLVHLDPPRELDTLASALHVYAEYLLKTSLETGQAENAAAPELDETDFYGQRARELLDLLSRWAQMNDEDSDELMLRAFPEMREWPSTEALKGNVVLKLLLLAVPSAADALRFRICELFPEQSVTPSLKHLLHRRCEGNLETAWSAIREIYRVAVTRVLEAYVSQRVFVTASILARGEIGPETSQSQLLRRLRKEMGEILEIWRLISSVR
jgi:hypothetical protein